MLRFLLTPAFLLGFAITSYAQTPSKELFTAVMKKNAVQVETLLSSGLDPNTPIEVVPGFPTTYLITAANSGELAVVKSLINHKAQVNQKDGFQATALMAAAGKGHKAVVEFLLSSGADAKAKDVDGKDATAMAKEGGNPEVVALLEQKPK